MAIDPLPAPPHRVTVDGDKYCLVVDLPMLDSLTDVELDIGDEQIRLCLPDGGTTTISLPSPIAKSSRDASATAKFSKKRRQLTISWSSLDETTKPKEVQGDIEICDQKEEKRMEEHHSPLDHDRNQSSDGLDGADHSRCGYQEKQDEPSIEPVPEVSAAAGKLAPAYGSLWNANSWHWEEKNCIDLLRSEVHSVLQRCTSERLTHVNDLSGGSVVLKNIVVDGEASFTLRRGKRILCYEVSVSFDWTVNDPYGSYLGVKGRGKVEELTQDEDRPAVSMETSTSSSGGADAKVAASWMKQKGSKEIAAYLSGTRLSDSMLSAEAARANALQDAARRAQEKEKAAVAQKATADERARLAAEQRKLEEARRTMPAVDAVQGSVWNANAWHWEEKPMTSWACSWLKGKLDGLTMNLFGGLASGALSDTQISGDASVSVRKGRPIALFQLRIECTWTVTASTAGVEESQGKLLVPEFTSEDGAKSAIEIQPASGAKKTSGQLLSCLRRDGAPAVRSILEQFSEALRGQLDRPA